MNWDKEVCEFRQAWVPKRSCVVAQWYSSCNCCNITSNDITNCNHISAVLPQSCGEYKHVTWMEDVLLHIIHNATVLCCYVTCLLYRMDELQVNQKCVLVDMTTSWFAKTWKQAPKIWSWGSAATNKKIIWSSEAKGDVIIYITWITVLQLSCRNSQCGVLELQQM